MAEAAEAQQRFFCHCCENEIYPKLPDFVCPRCDSAFIEEMSGDSSPRQDRTSSFSDELWQLLFMERSALLSHPPSSESDADGSEDVSANQRRPQEEMSQRPAVGGMAQQFLAGLLGNNGTPSAAPAALMLHLYGNPGDYVWGQGGLDAVVTELLGHLENSGPPPAEKGLISSLPAVCISQEQTDLRLECPVCREEYSLGESVRKLPCLHYFHCECIVPWLELHDTCPVCRKSLDGVDTGPPPAPEQPVGTEHQERQGS
ncbi:E3 ubiquitin-protein ligase RNF115 [Antennarius striatus]|uniref:E3 ubiquitin-protein ligase RNF115 n=1 Tax=Antennarius striatus TaxID=241820 RepID=UPI0035ADB068